MRVSFLSVAETELDEAVEWYEEQSKGLGKRFRDEIDNAIHRSMLFPRFNKEIEKGIYRSILREFFYKLIYAIEDDELVIIAIAHTHRHPDYWKYRIT
jgi:plasmid stabilization system protein ParE